VEPPSPRGARGDHVFHQFVVESDDRDALREHLTARGIATAIHYPVPIHRTGAYDTSDSLPVAQARADRICSLPIHPAMDTEAIARVGAAVCSFS
jgi:dTDP-4-amino-4,6-dideoxygalactose transaminase